MEKKAIEPKRLKIIISAIGCTSILLILSTICLTPNFVAHNLSQDGILEEITIIKINFIRIVSIIFGITTLFIIAIYLIKPKLFFLFYEKIRNIPFAAKLLLIVDLALCFSHLLILLFFNDHFLIRLFDLGQEANIPTWYSSIKLFLISLLAAQFAYRKFDSANITSWFLILLPLLFLILSMDESARIHESLGVKTDFILLNTKREETFFAETGVWMFIIGIPFIIFFLTLMISLKKYFANKRYVLLKIFFGMMIFLSGALGVETLSNVAENRVDIIFQNFFEEVLEMVGVTIIFWGFYHLSDFNWRKFCLNYLDD